MSELHAQHRQRCFETYLKGQEINVPDHVLLEMLLFYSIPRKDTNETAHMLINRFGSLSGVLSAPQEQIVMCEGVGQHSARLIRLVGEFVKRSNKVQVSSKMSFKCIESYGEFFINYMRGLSEERLVVLCLDRASRMLNITSIPGGKSETEVNVKEIVKLALNSDCDSVILCHNHCSGKAEPSDEDVVFTLEVRRAVSAVSVRLRDHIIVAENKYVSVCDYMDNRRLTSINRLI